MWKDTSSGLQTWVLGTPPGEGGRDPFPRLRRPSKGPFVFLQKKEHPTVRDDRWLWVDPTSVFTLVVSGVGATKTFGLRKEGRGGRTKGAQRILLGPRCVPVTVLPDPRSTLSGTGHCGTPPSYHPETRRWDARSDRGGVKGLLHGLPTHSGSLLLPQPSPFPGHQRARLRSRTTPHPRTRDGTSGSGTLG